MIRTIIFEDRKFDQRGILAILRDIPEISVIGVFDTIGEALNHCKDLKPDLIIADADIRGDRTAGPRFVKNVIKILPNAKILGLTIWAECIDPLKRAGCKEAVLKQFFDDEQAALKFIRETMIEPPLYGEDVEPPKLDEDEDHVLRMIANGHTENEICNALHKTRKQIRYIKDSLKDKFAVTSSKDTQLVSNAYLFGYFRTDEDLSVY